MNIVKPVETENGVVANRINLYHVECIFKTLDKEKKTHHQHEILRVGIECNSVPEFIINFPDFLEALIRVQIQTFMNMDTIDIVRDSIFIKSLEYLDNFCFMADRIE